MNREAPLTYLLRPVDEVLDPDYLDLPLEIRGLHEALLAYSGRLMSGGRIEGYDTWSMSQHRRRLGVGAGRRGVDQLVSKGYAHLDGGTLVLSRYPVEAEEKTRRLRQQGRKAAESRWSGDADGIGDGIAEGHALGNPKEEGESGSVSVSGSEHKKENGGGGGGGGARPATASPASLRVLSEPDRIRIVETLTGVHERSESWIKGPSVNLAELDQYGPSLGSRDIEDLKAAYAWFLGQPGRNRGDAHWQKTGHSLHMFVRQGLPAWDDYQKTAETAARLQDQRKADKLREKIERFRKAVEELEAAPPQPCPFHEDPENHEATAPKHLGRFGCLYCVSAELARLQAEPPVQDERPRVLDIMPPTLNIAHGGA